MEYEKLFQELFIHKVQYLICGGLAVNLYGIPRMTADIDLLLDFSKENILQFEMILKKLKYNSIVPVPFSKLSDKGERESLVSGKNMIAYSFFNSRSNSMNIDVLLDTPVIFEKMWMAREERKMDNFFVYIVSVEHLIEMKNYSSRIQDQNDVILLSKLIHKR